MGQHSAQNAAHAPLILRWRGCGQGHHSSQLGASERTPGLQTTGTRYHKSWQPECSKLQILYASGFVPSGTSSLLQVRRRGVTVCGNGQILYGVGLGLFGVAAYFYHISVKYMVKVGTPVPNGYQVKTLCTHGPFQYFQHPIYCALFGCSLSTPLVLDSACTTPTPTREGGRENCRPSAHLRALTVVAEARQGAFCHRWRFGPTCTSSSCRAKTSTCATSLVPSTNDLLASMTPSPPLPPLSFRPARTPPHVRAHIRTQPPAHALRHLDERAILMSREWYATVRREAHDVVGPLVTCACVTCACFRLAGLVSTRSCSSNGSPAAQGLVCL